MFYPRNIESSLSHELFRNPSSEYRGAPFWAWNCKLDRELLMREIDSMKEMGLGGFHIHSRTGLATEYLGDEFMSLVRDCNQKAKEEGMLCWLYDEDRYSSGFGGGLVTKDVRYRERYLVFSPDKPEEGYFEKRTDFDDDVEKGNKPKGYIIARYQVLLRDGYLERYERLDEDAVPCSDLKLWWAYLELSKESSWTNHQTYVNTLDPRAIQKFVQVTHETYFKHLGNDFGKSVPAIFTDEPKFKHKEAFAFAEDEHRVIIPFTDDFNETYKQTYGDDILDHLPELFWELPAGAVSLARYRYHDHIAERFATAFADTVGSWCEKHGIMLTGHMMSEETLESQTSALGEVMRSFRSFQLPGIDILCDHREYGTAKQAQSAAHQYGRPGVASELYGVTNWDFGFKGHKMSGDWQAALGVTVRIQHLNWVSMEGEGKRDYPASIGYQSPWYREYRMIEDYFSRINTALTRGKPHVRIGVIHPVESYWLYWGPMEQTCMLRDELETNYANTIEWLLSSMLDFDFIAESLLPDLCPAASTAPLKVGAMEYDVILIPGCHTLRSTTLERLEAFGRAGGQVIFIGEPGKYVDAVTSDRIQKLAAACTVIPFNKTRLVASMEEYRDIDVRLTDGKRPDNLLYQMREDGENRWLFISHAYEKLRESFWDMARSKDLPYVEKLRIKLKGRWKPVLYNAMNGDITAFPAEVKEEQTILEYDLAIHDSLLLCLQPADSGNSTAKKIEKIACSENTYLTLHKESPRELKDPVKITLSEPNVFLLDMAQYCIDNGVWEQEEELLRLESILRHKLDFAQREEASSQPWVNTNVQAPEHTLGLRFEFNSEIDLEACELALEHPEITTIVVNGIHVPSKVNGWYVDEAIKTVKLPGMYKGKNEILMYFPFGEESIVEWCYLLGDFGAQVNGRSKVITKPVRSLVFGDWTTQGLPFYAGNVTYHCTFNTAGGDILIETPQFKNPLLTVSLDGERKGNIALAPYTLKLDCVKEGEHTLEITAYGDRFNAFGQVHNCDDGYSWFGSCAWRTRGNRWSYQYRLKSMGVFISPRWYQISSGK